MSTPRQSSSPTLSTEQQPSSTTVNKESIDVENDLAEGNTDTTEGAASKQKEEHEDEEEKENNEIIGIAYMHKWIIHFAYS